MSSSCSFKPDTVLSLLEAYGRLTVDGEEEMFVNFLPPEMRFLRSQALDYLFNAGKLSPQLYHHQHIVDLIDDTSQSKQTFDDCALFVMGEKQKDTVYKTYFFADKESCYAIARITPVDRFVIFKENEHESGQWYVIGFFTADKDPEFLARIEDWHESLERARQEANSKRDNLNSLDLNADFENAIGEDNDSDDYWGRYIATDEEEEQNEKKDKALCKKKSRYSRGSFSSSSSSVSPSDLAYYRQYDQVETAVPGDDDEGEVSAVAAVANNDALTSTITTTTDPLICHIEQSIRNLWTLCRDTASMPEHKFRQLVNESIKNLS